MRLGFIATMSKLIHTIITIGRERMVASFFHWKGIVHYAFVPRCQTVNKELYLDVL